MERLREAIIGEIEGRQVWKSGSFGTGCLVGYSTRPTSIGADERAASNPTQLTLISELLGYSLEDGCL